MRREGVGARTPAPLALNATTDRRLELIFFFYFVLLLLFVVRPLAVWALILSVHEYPKVMNNKGCEVQCVCCVYTVYV